ncbi:DNA repair protein RecO [Rarobacter incanus]
MLRTHKLGESDRIITLLTRDHGKVRAVAKGVRRTASRYGARLEPFMHADVQFFIGRALDTVTQVETLDAFAGPISRDYEKFTAGTVILEAADKIVVAEREAARPQYWLVVGALKSLATGTHAPRSILDSYLLRALAVAGYAPTFDRCAKCGSAGPLTGFSPAWGGAVCAKCRPSGSAAPGREEFALLAALLTGEWDTIDRADQRDARRVSGLVAAYCQYHLERSLRSLPLAESIAPTSGDKNT